MGSFPKRDLSIFKVCNFLSWKHKVFEISKYKGKMKFNLSLGVQKWGVFPEMGLPKFKVLTIDARHMKFSA